MGDMSRRSIRPLPKQERYGPPANMNNTEDSEDNLVNIFGSEFTPYQAKVTRHKKQPSANLNTEETDNLMLLS